MMEKGKAKTSKTKESWCIVQSWFTENTRGDAFVARADSSRAAASQYAHGRLKRISDDAHTREFTNSQ